MAFPKKKLIILPKEMLLSEKDKVLLNKWKLFFLTVTRSVKDVHKTSEKSSSDETFSHATNLGKISKKD